VQLARRRTRGVGAKGTNICMSMRENIEGGRGNLVADKILYSHTSTAYSRMGSC
jgi:hypothetical protein